MKHSILNILKHIVISILLIATLEFIMVLQKLSPAAFALPSEIIMQIPKFFIPSGLLSDLVSTLGRTFIAFVFALPIGLMIGLITSKSKWIYRETTFMLDFVRSIPATALVPLFLVIFGPGDISKISIGIFSGSLVIAVSVLVGFQSLNEDRKRVSNLLGLKGLKRILFYELPEISPTVFVGARTAISLCLILVVVSEMFIGSNNGLGRVIMDRRYSDDVPTLYAAIVMTGLVGYMVNKVFLTCEYRLKLILGIVE